MEWNQHFVNADVVLRNVSVSTIFSKNVMNLPHWSQPVMFFPPFPCGAIVKSNASEDFLETIMSHCSSIEWNLKKPGTPQVAQLEVLNKTKVHNKQHF